MEKYYKNTLRFHWSLIIIMIVIIIPLNSFTQESPVARCGHSITSVDGELFMYGGSTTILETKSFQQNDRALLGNLWQWEESESAWAKKNTTNLPPNRAYHSANSNNTNGIDKLYIFFGADDNSSMHSDIWSYDPASNIWTEELSSGSSIPEARMMHSSTTVYDGKIVVFGGLTESGGIDENTWLYDPSTGIWTMGSPFPDMFRYGHSAVKTDGKVFVFGGMGPEDASNKMWVYNAETGQWILKSNNSKNIESFPEGRYHHAMIVSEEHNKIWILGGSTTFDDELSDVWEYDITLNSWSQLTDLPMPRTHFDATLFIEDNQQGEIVLFGGISNGTVIEESFTYPLEITDISELEACIELFENYPNPFNGTTEIEFSISTPSQVTLDVFNQLGKKVCCLINESKDKGQHIILFDASGLSAGIYFLKLQTGTTSQIKKCIIQ